MERAEEVLALGQVDGGLAADRAVDLGDERRRDMDDRHTAEPESGEEPRSVAERTATDRHQGLAPLDPEARQLASRVLDDRQPLRRLAFAAGRLVDLAPGPTQRGDERPADEPPGGRLGDDDRPSGLEPSRASPTAVGAMPSPITIRPIRVRASRRRVPPTSGPLA